MKIKCLLHVGPHKTATTSIQHALFCNKESLLKHSLFYPTLSSGVYREQHSEMAFWVKNEEEDKWKSEIQKFNNEVRVNNYSAIIISGEEFSAIHGTDNFRNFLEYIFSIWDVRLIYIKRNKKDIILSNLMQNLMGETGFFFKNNYQIEDIILRMSKWEDQKECYFSQIGAGFISYESIKGSKMAYMLVEKYLNTTVPGLVTENLNSLNNKTQSNMLLTYPLRVMLGLMRNEPNLSPGCVRDSLKLLTQHNDEEGLSDLVSSFQVYLKDKIDLLVN